METSSNHYSIFLKETSTFWNFMQIKHLGKILKSLKHMKWKFDITNKVMPDTMYKRGSTVNVSSVYDRIQFVDTSLIDSPANFMTVSLNLLTASSIVHIDTWIRKIYNICCRSAIIYRTIIKRKWYMHLPHTLKIWQWQMHV